MNIEWGALLLFTYSVVWKWLGVMAVLFVINLILGASLMKDVDRRSIHSFTYKAQIINLIGAIFGILLVLWIVILIVNAGHWIGMY